MLLKYYQKLDDAISYLAASFCNEKKLIKSVLGNKRITYIDIGTNQGTYLEFLSNFLKFKSVDCFEPQEELGEFGHLIANDPKLTGIGTGTGIGTSSTETLNPSFGGYTSCIKDMRQTLYGNCWIGWV